VTAGPLSDFQFYPPAVAMDAAGDFVVAWAGAPTRVHSGDHVYAQAYAAGGTPRGGVIDVSGTPVAKLQSYADVRHPAVAMQANGSFVVAWVSNSDYSPTNGYPDIFYNNTVVHAQLYSAGGAPQGAAASVASLSDIGPEARLAEDKLSLAMSASGDYAVVWSQAHAAESIYGTEQPLRSPFHARFYSAAGKAAGLPVNLPIAAAGLKYLSINDFAAARDASGDLLLSWAAANGFKTEPTQETLYLRRYSKQGLPAAAATAVTTRAWNDEYVQRRSLQLAPLPAGGVAVAWADYPNAKDYARYFAADGSAAGASFAISTAQTWNLDTLIDPSGNLLAAWDLSIGNDGAAGIQAQSFQGP
jgi:hypothetical protein